MATLRSTGTWATFRRRNLPFLVPGASTFAAANWTAARIVTGHAITADVDSCVGCLNYLLVDTELHRYHHSAHPAEAKNFGALVSVWGQVFGTFVYRPVQVPRALGIDEPPRYPADTQLLSFMLYPLHRGWASGGRPTKRSPR